MDDDKDIFEGSSIGMLEITDFDKKGVFQLSKMNPDNLYMVMVYANWCPPCKKAKPHYRKVSEILQKANIQTAFLTAINATPGERMVMVDGKKINTVGELVDKAGDFFGVTAFPSFFFIKNGKSSKLYEGERTVDAFLNAIASQNKEVASKRDQLK